ncbi:MAG: C1 family peptidase [Candidatus Limnocylindrales bacterium]|jgi:hypothetical protein
MAYGLGRVPSPVDLRDHSLAMYAPAAVAAPPLPSYAPRYLWIVLDQDGLPACVGYSGALGRQIETMLEASEALNFDPDDLYRLCKQQDGSPNTDGTFIRVACKVLRSQGGLVKAVLPGLTPEQARAAARAQALAQPAAGWHGIDLPSAGEILNAIMSLIDWIEGPHQRPQPSNPPVSPQPVHVGERIKIASYARLRTLTEVKQTISAYGDAWIGSPWCNAWFTPGPDGVLPAPDQMAGGHAYKFVGYDDSKGAFLMQNSWGSGWGMLGHAWMPYQYVSLGDLLEWEAWQTFS